MQIAKNYAESLYQHYNDKKNLDRFIQDSEYLLNILRKDSEIIESLIANEQKISNDFAILTKIMNRVSIGEELINAINFIMGKKRINYLQVILEEILKLDIKSQNILLVEVISAHNLEQDQYEQIRNILENKFHSKIEINCQIDPEILGGIIVKIDNVIYDASILNSLIITKDKLIKTILKN